MMDLHVHSTISHDGQASIRDYCLQARELGITELGFSEHLDLFPGDPHFGLHDYERYLAEVREARAEFPELKIRMGVEATFLPEIRKELQEYLEGKDYDYVLAAVHLLEGGRVTVSEESGCTELFSRREAADCYEEYFELTLEAVRSGLFDGLAHLDLINRYGLGYCPDWEWTACYGLIRRTFEGMLKRGMALEINGSGFRSQPARSYPDQDLIRFYRELQGEAVTVGSDAHKLEDLGGGIGQGLAILKYLGFARLTTFERRNPLWVEIGNLKLVSD
jgi:histidinol-phosphatase (PHP family)